MKSFVKTGIVLGMVAITASCFNTSRPNYQYMPNMYEPVGYETYQESGAFRNGIEAQLPAEGSIPRGWQPYEYLDTNEDYEAAKANLKSPLDPAVAEADLAAGKTLYGIYCAVCHGTRGDGKGQLATTEKFLGIPAYNDPARAITEGSVYHVIYYGKNAMGSHAGQLSEKERWQVAAYVMTLKQELLK
ncbi:MAG: cytochrome c [Sinomicrobium sp.]|nr:cytochrome c [Sinomicrobium sp.]